MVSMKGLVIIGFDRSADFRLISVGIVMGVIIGDDFLLAVMPPPIVGDANRSGNFRVTFPVEFALFNTCDDPMDCCRG